MKNAFTLIELLVALTIIGIISTIGVSVFQSAQVTTRDNIRKSNLREIALALETYYKNNNQYIGGSGNCTDTANLYGSTDVNKYLPSIPQDPKTDQAYCYVSVSNGRAFSLFASLEKPNSSDPNVISNCSSYNFTVTSENLNPSCPGEATLPPVPSYTTPTYPTPQAAGVDQDGDSYLAGTRGTICSNGKVCDCFDLNANAKPNQTVYFSVSRGSISSGNDSFGNSWNSYDYNCDGAASKQYAYYISGSGGSGEYADSSCSQSALDDGINSSTLSCGDVSSNYNGGCNSLVDTWHFDIGEEGGCFYRSKTACSSFTPSTVANTVSCH